MASAFNKSASMEFEKSSSDEPSIDVPTAALNFEGFSFLDEDGFVTHEHLTKGQNEALREYLFREYNASDITYSFPFLVLRCMGEAPPPDKRPFTVAGAIAIWLSEDDDHFIPFYGHMGGSEDFISIDKEMTDAMKPLTVPPQAVIDYLAFKTFPECNGLAVIYNTLVVELPQMSFEEFRKRLASLPMGIAWMPFALEFSNGPLPNTERRRRAVQPRPQELANLVADETDYVKLDGKFYPGTMIQTKTYRQTDSDGNTFLGTGQVTAGILVTKGGEQRLTCSFHNWKPLADEEEGLFGQTTPEAKEKFRVLQGSPGTDIGFVRERMGNTDVALIELNDGISFENKFMEIDSRPKRFLHSSENKVGDVYMIDSFAVGKQMLRGMGARFVKRVGRRGPFFHPDNKPADLNLEPQMNETYIELQQGIYATTAEVMRTSPHIRDSVCGSVILRAQRGGDKSSSSGLVPLIQEGGISGMLHYADLQLKNVRDLDAANFLCYADVFDSLIDDGWTVAE